MKDSIMNEDGNSINLNDLRMDIFNAEDLELVEKLSNIKDLSNTISFTDENNDLMVHSIIPKFDKRPVFSIYRFLKFIEPNKVVLAGGALRKVINPLDKILDYDIFFLDFNYIQQVKSWLVEYGFDLKFECPKGELFTYKLNSLKIQLICKKQYNDIEHLLSSFDFTICQLAYDGERFYFSNYAVRSIKRRELHLSNNIEFPMATMNRIYKYKLKGFKIESCLKEFCIFMSNSDYDPTTDQLYID
jgi:hypothetical protein